MVITVQDFTGIYDYQPFMQELREKAANSADIHWLDCTKIVGTDCYCDDDAIQEINALIDNTQCDSSNKTESSSIPKIHFFDNGNYHYMSKLWTDRIQEPFSLIVFDHHPDMQPPRFGGILSCGGWVKEVLDHNKFIQNVVIIGVKDELIETVREELSQSGETAFLDKVIYIKESELSIFSSPLSALSSEPIYLSIDKDALSSAFAVTNWDHGSLTTELLKAIIAELATKHKILGIDICGERSQDFEGDEIHSVQEADSLNNALNYELVEFLQNL